MGTVFALALVFLFVASNTDYRNSEECFYKNRGISKDLQLYTYWKGKYSSRMSAKNSSDAAYHNYLHLSIPDGVLQNICPKYNIHKPFQGLEHHLTALPLSQHLIHTQ